MSSDVQTSEKSYWGVVICMVCSKESNNKKYYVWTKLVFNVDSSVLLEIPN